MSVGTVILLGLGPDANLLPTLGYLGGAPTPPPPPVGTTKTGTGGIDGLRRIYKPSGMLERPAKKPKADARVEARVQESHDIAVEVAQEAKRAFDVEDYLPIERMTAAQVDAEIGRLMHKRIKTEEDNVALLILLAMVV